MIRQLWRRVRAWLAPPSPSVTPSPFSHEMRAYTVEGIQQSRASLRAQRRDRERTNFMADDLLGGGQPPPPERSQR